MSEDDEAGNRLPSDHGGDGSTDGSDPSAHETSEKEPSGTCELCGGPTVERHCKIVCTRCGYRRDCSDP